MSKQKNFKVIGLVLMLCGMAIFTGLWSPFAGATVIYNSPPSITPLMPAGSASFPFALVKGQQLQLVAYITPADGVSWASCQVLDGNGNSLVVYTLSRDNAALAIVDEGANNGSATGANFRSSTKWACPSVDGATYTFRFKAANNEGQVTTVDVPAFTAAGVADGVFTINGHSVNTDSRIVVSDPVLALMFQATSHGDLITGVQVQLKDSGGNTVLKTVQLTETTADQFWEGSLELPSEGTYVLTGTFFQSNQWFTRMSIVAEMGGESQSWLNMNVVMGIAMVAIGLALYSGKLKV